MFLCYYLLSNPRPNIKDISSTVTTTIVALSVSSIIASCLGYFSLKIRIDFATMLHHPKWLVPVEYSQNTRKKVLFSIPGVLLVDDFRTIKILRWSRDICSFAVGEKITIIDTGSVSVETHLFGLKKKYLKRTYQILGTSGKDLLIESSDFPKNIRRLQELRSDIEYIEEDQIEDWRRTKFST
jgi:hypothetical protein